MRKKGTILVVEDEQRIRRTLVDYLKINEYETLEAKDGEEALEVFYQNNHMIDLILLDVMLPKESGTTVLKEIRKQSTAPIIMLTAKGEEYDQIEYFKQGADDFLAKPFSLELLLGHVEAIAKRCFQNRKKRVEMGNIVIDMEQRKVVVKEESIELTPKEYDLLVYLIQNKGIVMERETILNAIWGFQYVGDIRTVDTHIKQLRAKLSSDSNYIKTVHGIGYRFEVEHDSLH